MLEGLETQVTNILLVVVVSIGAYYLLSKTPTHKQSALRKVFAVVATIVAIHAGYWLLFWEMIVYRKPWLEALRVGWQTGNLLFFTGAIIWLALLFMGGAPEKAEQSKPKTPAANSATEMPERDIYSDRDDDGEAVQLLLYMPRSQLRDIVQAEVQRAIKQLKVEAPKPAVPMQQAGLKPYRSRLIRREGDVLAEQALSQKATERFE